MKRWTGNMLGERYLGNSNSKEVHDLDNEQTGPNECQIEEIIRAGHDVPFKKLSDADDAGYGRCAYCLP